MDNSIQNRTVIQERNSGLLTKLILALVLGALLALLNLLVSKIIHLTSLNSILLISCEIILYAVLLILISRPTRTKIIKKTEVKTIPQTIIKEVIKEPEKKELNIPKYEFIGSMQTLTYHKRSCRLSKLIKKKYQISNNNENYFKRNNFKPCKMCIKSKNKEK